MKTNHSHQPRFLSNSTLIFIAALSFLGCAWDARAQTQWATAPNGTDIYNTNTGKVGIGTQNPENLLHIGGSGGVGFTIDTPGNAKGRVFSVPNVWNWLATTMNA